MSKLGKLLIITLCFGSCKNQIEIAAPWKETIAVYGLLDPAAAVNYIRIEKAYLDPEGNAFKFANINDSIYPQGLTVKLIVRRNGNFLDSIFPVLTDGNAEGIKKDSGLFSSAPNYLYKITDKIFDSRLINNGSEDYEYELIVKNNKTGYQCSAKTFTTGLLEPLAPVSSSTNQISISDKSTGFLILGYREGRKVKTYDMLIRFWYTETRQSNPSQIDTLSFDWPIFQNKPTTSLAGYEQKISSVPSYLFYEILKNKLKPNADILRKGLYCDVEFYGAGEDLYTYIQVNVPSIGIVQKKPEYTNISNGLGIFSSRYITSIKKATLHPDFIGLLKNSTYTKGLNF